MLLDIQGDMNAIKNTINELEKLSDEEKAEEYVKEQILKHNRDVVCRPKKAVAYIDELKQAYLDGLAEGRKDIKQLKKDCSIWESRAKGLLHKNEIVDVYTLQKENADLNRDKAELLNSVTELKNKVTELEAQLKNNPYVELLQKEKSEMAEDFAKQIEKMKNKLNCSKYHYCLCKDKTCKDCKDWKLQE